MRPNMIWFVTLLSESCVCTVFSVAFNMSAIAKQDFNVIKTCRNWNSIMSARAHHKYILLINIVLSAF